MLHVWVILIDLLRNIQATSVTSDEDSEKCTSDVNICCILKLNLQIKPLAFKVFNKNILILHTVIYATEPPYQQKYAQNVLNVGLEHLTCTLVLITKLFKVF